jgi:hypothetical protein
MTPRDNLATLAGDIILNTDQRWAIDGDGLDDLLAGETPDPTAIDLQTVALFAAIWAVPSLGGCP